MLLLTIHEGNATIHFELHECMHESTLKQKHINRISFAGKMFGGPRIDNTAWKKADRIRGKDLPGCIREQISRYKKIYDDCQQQGRYRNRSFHGTIAKHPGQERYWIEAELIYSNKETHIIDDLVNEFIVEDGRMREDVDHSIRSMVRSDTVIPFYGRRPVSLGEMGSCERVMREVKRGFLSSTKESMHIQASYRLLTPVHDQFSKLRSNVLVSIGLDRDEDYWNVMRMTYF